MPATWPPRLYVQCIDGGQQERCWRYRVASRAWLSKGKHGSFRMITGVFYHLEERASDGILTKVLTDCLTTVFGKVQRALQLTGGPGVRLTAGLRSLNCGLWMDDCALPTLRQPYETAHRISHHCVSKSPQDPVCLGAYGGSVGTSQPERRRMRATWGSRRRTDIMEKHPTNVRRFHAHVERKLHEVPLFPFYN